jgi:hypothetical protein
MPEFDRNGSHARRGRGNDVFLKQRNVTTAAAAAADSPLM